MADDKAKFGIVVVPDQLTERVQAFAEELAAAEAAEVEAFAAGIDIERFSVRLGLRDIASMKPVAFGAGAMRTRAGTNCWETNHTEGYFDTRCDD